MTAHQEKYQEPVFLGSDAVWAGLQTIGSIAGRNDKQQALAALAAYEDARRVLQLAYDPYVTFGVAPRRMPGHGTGGREFDDLTWELLLVLSERELTGDAARQAIEDEARVLTAASADLLHAVLAKDLRAGVAAKSINAVAPGLVSEFAVSLAAKFEPAKADWRRGMLIEPKLDGVRVIVEVRRDEVTFRTRTGRVLDSLAHLADDVLRVWETPLDPTVWESGLVLDGEVISGAFNDTVSQVRSSGAAEDAVLHVFDVLPLVEFQARECRLPMVERREELARMALGSRVQLTDQSTVYSADDAMAIAMEWQAAGLEGAVVKDPLAGYAFKRDRAWMKIKGYETHDLPVVGVFEGEGRLAGTLGGLIVDYRGVQVRVGSGFSDQDRAQLWTLWHQGDLDGVLVEVGAHETTRDGSLRHPRLVRVRWDKSA